MTDQAPEQPPTPLPEIDQAMSDETPGQVFEALLKEWEELLLSEGYLEELENRALWRARFDRAQTRFIEALGQLEGHA